MRENLSVMVVLLIVLPEFILLNPDLESTTPVDFQVSEAIPEKPLPGDVNNLLTSVPQVFTENRGQLENNEVRFYDQDGAIWFTDDGVWFELREYAETRDQGDSNPLKGFKPPEPMEYKRVILKQEFVGANHVQPVGRERLSWNSNFFYGNDSSKWCPGVPNYAEIWFENIYDGIDLRYYTAKSGLKYDLIVYPGAVVDQIRIKYTGSEGLEIDGFGNLIIKTPIKDIMDSELFIYQDYNGLQHTVNGKFMIYNNLEYGFEILQDYNKYEVLVIDPNVTLDYSTYIGGTNRDLIGAGLIDSSGGIAIDSTGNAFINRG